MSENIKIKYVFQKHPGYKVTSAEEERTLLHEIRNYVMELEMYRISLRTLCNNPLSYKDRNNVLNISLSLINDAPVVSELYNTKELPVRLISKNIRIPTKVIEKYSNYIIAYMILFGFRSYSNIVKKLSIGTVVDSMERGEEKDRGLMMGEAGTTSCILTPQGEFIYLDVPGDSSIGTMVKGKNAIFTPKRNRIILAVLTAASIILITLASYYAKPSKIIQVMADTQVELSYNKAGRLIESYPRNYQGSEALNKTVFSDKKIASSIGEYLDTAITNQNLKNRDITLIVLSGDVTTEDFKGDYLNFVIKKHKLKIRINLKDGNALFLP